MPSQRQPDHVFYRQLQEADGYYDKFLADAERAWDFHDGNQWTKEEQNELESRCQQATVVNVCKQVINTFVTVEQGRRTDYIVVGRESSDDEMADLLGKLLKQTTDDANLNYFLTNGGRSGAISGIAWWEVVPEEDPDTGKKFIKVHERKCEEIYFDPFARRPDLSDARYIIREVWTDIDIAKNRYPEHADQLDQAFDTAFNTRFDGQETVAQIEGGDDSNTTNKFFDFKKRRIAIYEHYYKKPDNKIGYVVWSNDLFFQGSDDPAADNPSPYKYNYYSFIPFIALRGKDGKPIGILDDVIPIQESINKLISKFIWNVSSLRTFFERNTFVDPEDAKLQINNPNCFIELEEGSISQAKLRIDQALAESQHLMNMLGFMVNMVQRITGINDALIGFGGNNARSGIQEVQRAQQGAAMQSPAIENLYYSKQQMAKVILKQIGEFYTDERIIRVTQPNGTVEYVPLNSFEMVEQEDGTLKKKPFNTIDEIIKYDVVLREERPFTSARERTGSMISEIIKSFPPLAQALILPFVDTLPISNKEDIKKRIEQVFSGQQDQLAQETVNQRLTELGLLPAAQAGRPERNAV